MNIDLTGKSALVCGASKGIGAACAAELASLGACVITMARNEEALGRVTADLPTPSSQTHTFVVADFSDPASVASAAKSAAAEHGPIHILVNNTGGPPGGAAIDADPDSYRAAFEAHVVCNQLLAQTLTPGMRTEKYGRIINIISTSVKAPIPGLGVSNVIRGAVASWAKTLATELGPFGITVNNVLPGFTKTDRLDSILRTRAERAGTSVEEVADGLFATIPARRFAEPAETASAVAFLASPAAAYINGINLPVDGGRLPTL